MPDHSAGLLLFRRGPEQVELFLVHFGGPYWARKDAGAWSIPKGLVDAGESPWQAARREFAEETGFHPQGNPIALGDFRQSNGKVVTAFAVEGDCDPELMTSNTFALEWPPRSGRIAEFPEADRGAWFDSTTAEEKLVKGQRPIVARLLEFLGGRPS